MRTYMQISRHKRLPSLWEEFGDGVTIQPHDTDDLRPETTDHREIGWNPPAYHQLHMGISAYQDRVQDKIMLVPVSLGSFKTQNVKSSYIRGIDVSVHWRQDSLGLTYTRLWPQNLLPDLSPPTITQLVGIPEHTWTGFMGYTWKDTLTLRWLSRYRSLVFRDQENTVCLPGTHKHDVNLDITLLHGWRLGFEIRNLWNVLWVPIDAPPLSRGKTAYSDVAGAPLPGRQWMMSMDKAW
jgi:outer membrane receptor protein involved in Fe transport